MASCIPTILLLVLSSGADWRADVDALERAGEIDRAIARVEDHLEREPRDAEAWRWLAVALERLVDEGGRSALVLSEAAAAWDEVTALQPGNADANAAAAVARLRARTATFAGTAHGDRASFARDVLDVRARVVEARTLAPGSAKVLLAETYWLASLGLADVALEGLRAAIAETPGSIELHRVLVDLHVALSIEERLPRAYGELVAAHPNDAVVRWYAGYAARLDGDLAARERRDADAGAAYARCVATMREASALDPSFAESALWVEMQARTASAWSALDADDVERAEREWLAVLEEAPEYAERTDGLGRTSAQGLGRLGGRYHARDDIVKAQGVSRALAEVTDDAWSWNNVGYLLREIGSDTEASGDPGAFDLARSTFIESYRAYTRAATLAPHEPRIVNDTALIQVYHLRDDLEGAERMLNEAIRVGEEQLAELGYNPPESERFPIAQAVGDAYQNLGFLYYRLRDDPKTAREYFVRSIQTDSGARRGVVASIRAIDAGQPGGRSLGQRPTPPAPPEPPQPPTEQERRESTGELAGQGAEERQRRVEREVDVRWERSLALALETAEAEGTRALAYHRVGGGVGPSVEYLQRYLHSTTFERAAAGAITVLADGLRHTFTDRRRDGRLVMCPRAGGVTCAEHIACAAEFEARWRSQQGPRLGLASNGLFEVTADGLERRGRMQDTYERFRPGRDFDEEPEPAGAPQLRPELPRDAATLAKSRSLPHRRELERRVFEPASEQERADALAALAAHPSADNDELLHALARQKADPELAASVLAAWRAELGSGSPLFALQTSRSAAERAPAVAALARVGDAAAERAVVARWLLAEDRAPGDGAVERASNADLSELAAELER